MHNTRMIGSGKQEGNFSLKTSTWNIKGLFSEIEVDLNAEYVLRLSSGQAVGR
jgi:hypothetical protein